MATLALIAADDDAFQRKLLQPLLSGFTKGSETVTLEEGEKAIAEAVFRHMWQEAKMWWAQRQASMATPGSSSTTVAPPTGPSLPATSVPTSGDKIPKSLPAGVWSQQVNKYNSEQLRGRDRAFPETMLLGAEVVLARMWHEHHVSKMYTPTSLGEILSKRSFAATGEVNMLAKNPKKASVLTIEDEQLVQEDEKQWSPRSVLSIMDGVEAVVWAWVLLEIGEEHHCHAFGKWCISKARSRPQKLEQFKQWWDAAGWKISMRMRAGATFGEASNEIMADTDLFNDHMSREILQRSPPQDGNSPARDRRLSHPRMSRVATAAPRASSPA